MARDVAAPDAHDHGATIQPWRALQSAPNVVIVPLDDMGVGASSAYGGPRDTPAAEQLAKGGLTSTVLPYRRATLTDTSSKMHLSTRLERRAALVESQQ